jgi:hypothetical protein
LLGKDKNITYFRKVFFLATLLLGFPSDGTPAPAAPDNEQTCDDLVELSLEISGSSIMPCGVVVGELIVENSGDVTCLFTGGISIESGNFLFELEQPDGSIVELDYSSHPNGGLQWAELDPGDVFFHPVCLMKLRGKYLFEESGKYRLRGIYHGKQNVDIKRRRAPKKKKAIGQLDSFSYPKPAISNWVEISVKDPHYQMLQFMNSHPWKNVFRSFAVYEEIEQIWGQLGGVYEYNHEQEKLMIYQRGRKAIAVIILGMDNKGVCLPKAKELLALARKCKVGEKMWEWIIARLEESYEEAQHRGTINARNGYIFH